MDLQPDGFVEGHDFSSCRPSRTVLWKGMTSVRAVRAGRVRGKGTTSVRAVRAGRVCGNGTLQFVRSEPTGLWEGHDFSRAVKARIWRGFSR